MGPQDLPLEVPVPKVYWRGEEGRGEGGFWESMFFTNAPGVLLSGQFWKD